MKTKNSFPEKLPPAGMARGFTMMELLVVVAILAVVAVLLLPVAGRIMAKGKTTKCIKHLQGIGMAAIRYASENEMTLPVTSHQRRKGGHSWTITLQEYADGKVFFRCPVDEHKTRPYSYVINDFLTPNPAGAPDLDYSRLTRLEDAHETMLFAESSLDYDRSDHFHFTDYRGQRIPEEQYLKQVAAERHEGGANYLFADGHLETLSWVKVREMLEEEGSRFIDPTKEKKIE